MSKTKKKQTKSKGATSRVKTVEHTGGVRDYLRQSSELRTGLILVLPLFLLYQVGVLFTGGVRNGADFVTSALWWVVQGSMAGYLGVNALVLLGFLALLFFGMRDKRLMPVRMWPVVLAESTVYALCFGTVVVQLMSVFGLDATLAQGAGSVAELSLVQKLVLSIGAGLYEEIVFRLIGVGGIYWLLGKFGKDGQTVSTVLRAVLAVLVSSLIFSAIHYVGEMGNAFTLGSFLFRFFAGILLAVLFYVRGFAVAVYTHAIYDIIVMVFR